MKKIGSLGILFIFLFTLSCEQEVITNEITDVNQPIIKEVVKGFVQKGPFINGTPITISELTSDLTQTGKTFGTQILDNKGSFELRQIELVSQFVELKADGYYFNEITGEKSTARLTLFALSDLTDKSNLNINLMSHLEKGRINHLISQGVSFGDAKQQAQSEILRIFSIEKPDMLESEMLDISKDGEDNAILLAVSIIIQGFRTDAELSELIANISTDIKEDGVLDSDVLGSQLINHVQLMSMSSIRENLISRYEEIGVEVTIPNFEKYVQIFKENTNFETTSLIQYPEFSNYGENILFSDKTNLNSGNWYSLAVDLPEATKLKIVLTGGMWYYEYLPNGPVNWTVSAYNHDKQTQTFTSINAGQSCDLKIRFQARPPLYRDTITVEYYENKMDVVTKSKQLIIE